MSTGKKTKKSQIKAEVTIKTYSPYVSYGAQNSLTRARMRRSEKGGWVRFKDVLGVLKNVEKEINRKLRS